MDHLQAYVHISSDEAEIVGRTQDKIEVAEMVGILAVFEDSESVHTVVESSWRKRYL